MYIYLNTFILGCSGGLSIGNLLVGSQQVGPECSSSTASMHQPPNQDKQHEGYHFALEDLTNHNLQND